MPAPQLIAKADPSPVARSVERLLQLNQVSGSFVRFAPPSLRGGETLEAVFAEARPMARTEDPDRLVVQLAYRCIVATPQSIPAIQLADPVGEAPPEGLRFMAEAEFVAVYQLRPGTPFSEDQLEAFALVNVPLNVVPYWREFLDSAARRAGMPNLLAPLFKTDPAASAKSDR